MKTLLTTIAFILLANFCFSQADTTFFDTDWKSCKRSNAKYYQLVEKRGSLFIEKDFFMNNKPQALAECLSIEPYIRNGKWTEYKENGAKANTGYYTNEKALGIWAWWDDDGKDSVIGEYKTDGNIFILNKGHYVTIRGKKQFVIVEGKGSPTVVFITGKGDAQYNYRVVYKEIKKTNQIFSYDRAGLGNSEWIDNTAYHHTKNYLSVCKGFLSTQLPKEFEVTKAEQIDLLNRSISYFKETENFNEKEFTKVVLEQPDIIKSFKEFKQDYIEQNEIDIEDQFDISAPAVKKQARVFKSVLKLDRNFHIYIHGDKDLIEKGVEKNGRKFYKIYYDEEL